MLPYVHDSYVSQRCVTLRYFCVILCLLLMLFVKLCFVTLRYFV